jgi:hypothetical protein
MAVDKIVDFAKYDPHNRDDNVRLRWLADAYRDKIQAELSHATLSVLAGSLGTDSVAWYNQQQSKAYELIEDIARMRQSWLVFDKVSEIRHQDQGELKDRYEQAWGIDLDSEEGQAQIAEAITYFDQLG